MASSHWMASARVRAESEDCKRRNFNLGRTAIAFIPTVYELSRCVRCARFQAIEFDELKDFERNVQGLQRNNQILLR